MKSNTIFTVLGLILGTFAAAKAGGQDNLPFPPPPSDSKAGPTIAKSVYSPTKAVSRLPAGVPNMLIIMLDDVGPALPDTYGGPINTPTLPRVANSGRINGIEVAKGHVPRTAVLGFTANDAFDVGMDSYSPVSLAYFDRAPFKFNGQIDKMKISYTK
jgi:hypothetical protein